MSHWAERTLGPSAERPEVPIERFLNADEFLAVYECMADAGVPVEFGEDGGVSWSWSSDDPIDAELARYTCQAQYPLYPPQAGSFTDEQHEYLYDYYQDVLVPCLLLQGYPVDGDVPTREEFNDLTSIHASWSPYSFIESPSDWEELEALYATCPAIPFSAPVAD